VREVLQEWTGEKLKPTSLYGIRVYQRGARLLSHVDRFETHAASLIVNVAQEGTDPETPWPVEIYDHSDHMHEVGR
jgi:prolyl 4-hydroxylase